MYLQALSGCQATVYIWNTAFPKTLNLKEGEKAATTSLLLAIKVIKKRWIGQVSA